MHTRRNRARATHINRRDMVKAAGVGSGLMIATTGAMLVPSRLVSAQDVTLSFWTPGGSPAFCEMHNELTQEYASQNPGINFNEVQCGVGEGDDYTQVFLAAVAAGNPPDATILWNTPVSFGARDALVALDELMASATYAQAENWPAGILESCRFDGQTFGLPVAAGMYGMWYNRELFESKGIPSDRASFPKTWDELRQLSKEFTVWDGDYLESAGFVPIRDTITLPIWSALNGGQLYDAANQTYTINAESNVAMMEYMVAWLDEEYKGDITLVDQAGSWQAYPDDEGQPPAFQEGRVATCESGSWMMGDFYQYIEPVFEEWDVAPYPVGPGGTESVSGYWPNWLAIPEGSEHVEEAFAYLDFLSGEGIVKWFEVIPDMPTNTKVPDVVPQVVVERRGEEFATEIMDFFRSQAQVATAMWNSPVEDFVNDQLATAVERILTKASSPADALAEAQNAAQQELESFLSDAAG
jgi:multiple sugar transport system substrate-binding protein